MKKFLNIPTGMISALVLALGLTSALNAQAAPSFDPSVPAALQTEIMQDLTFVNSMQGSSATAFYQKIFGASALNGPQLMGFFNQRILTFNMDSCGGGSSVAACVQPMYDSNTMWITPNYVNNAIPQIYRISIIFHESRHTEDDNNNWAHVKCPVPYLDDNGHDIVGIVSGTKMEGLPACDDTAIGAYGLQAVLLKNIEKNCTNCGQKVQMDAKLYGDDTINRISDLTARRQLEDDLQK
jgi:hypothetical protein